jgi:hypothetical protein
MPKRRRSIHLTDPQYEALRASAEKLGISVAELIRLIVHEWLERREGT